jgi:predicted metal-dependent hydrolase
VLTLPTLASMHEELKEYVRGLGVSSLQLPAPAQEAGTGATEAVATEHVLAEPPWPPVSVRVGPRARRVRLVMSEAEGLVVVVPRGFDQTHIPGILENRRSWIERTWRRYEAGWLRLTAQPPRLPDRIALPAVREDWTVEYRLTGEYHGGPGSRPNMKRQERVAVRTRARESGLLVHGAVDDAEACRRALARWLVRRATEAFVPRLAALAVEHEFTFARVSLRHQRTRWGSCSQRKTISLNARLLFLEPDLVDYVLLHELCHTVHMDHSERFWCRMEACRPGSRDYRRRLRAAREEVPTWLDRPLDRCR